MNIDLEGKHVLVTGGSRGIGKDIVEQFAKAGATVAFTYRSSDEAAKAICNDLDPSGERVKAYQADGTDPEAASSVIESVLADWETLDVLVNNAGITRDGLLLRMSQEDWSDVLSANLDSVFNYCKAVYRPMMKQRTGKIINISSVVASMGNAGQANYAASKAGMIGFTKSLARELAGRNIAVNVVAPGFIETDMTSAVSEKAREAMLGAVPMGRIGQPTDVSNAVLFLASGLADYVTGHVLHVNGGMYM